MSSSTYLTGPWTWTPKKERACQLLAEDVLTDDQIAKKCGLPSRASLAKWKRAPEFNERLQQYIARTIQKHQNEGLGRIDARIKKAEEDHATLEADQQRLEQATKDRAAHYREERDRIVKKLKSEGKNPAEVPPIPGADTGVVVRNYVTVAGEARIQYEIDHPTMLAKQKLIEAKARLRQQIAQELGDLKQRLEVSGNAGGAIIVKLEPGDENL